jgi:hypothetical protein
MAYSILKSHLNRDIAKEICSYVPIEKMCGEGCSWRGCRTFVNCPVKKIAKRLSCLSLVPRSETLEFNFADEFAGDRGYVRLIVGFLNWTEMMFDMILFEAKLIYRDQKDRCQIRENKEWRRLYLNLIEGLIKIAMTVSQDMEIIKKCYKFLYTYAKECYFEIAVGVDDIPHYNFVGMAHELVLGLELRKISLFKYKNPSFIDEFFG